MATENLIVNPYRAECEAKAARGQANFAHAARDADVFDEGVAAERARLLGMLRDPDAEILLANAHPSGNGLPLVADVLSARLTDPKEDA